MSKDDNATGTQSTGYTVESFNSSPYEDSSWRIVGEFVNQDYFEPMTFRAVAADGSKVDPMFSDYGGLLGASEGELRAHAAGSQGGGGSRGFSASKRRSQEREETDEEEAARIEKLIQQAVEDARQKAFDEGRQAAQDEFDEKMRSLEAQYGEVLRDIGAQLNESLDGIERQAVDLSIAISQKRVGTIVEINPEYILGVVRDALRLAGGARIKTVRVSPQDMEFFGLIKPEKEFKEYDGTWQFQSDETIKTGCIVETSSGQVDYDLDRAWQRIADQVAKVRR
jgi:flagellar biosynthesis/type III secretory pathway protein FliH